MVLSNELISQFVKITNDTNNTKSETIVYGTIQISDNKKYVRLDGSTMATPISSMTDVKDGDRVTVIIKNHTAIVTGNLTNPSVNTETEFQFQNGQKTTLSDICMITVPKIEADTAKFNTVYAGLLGVEYIEVEGELVAKSAVITDLQAGTAKFDQVVTDVLEVEYVDVDGVLTAKSATIERLLADSAEFKKLDADYAEFKQATIDTLYTESGEIKFANIDFSNIGKAAMEYLYATSGLIKNVTIGDATISGELIGVTIKGDLIEAGTLVADKLVIHGEDGIYYKLNFENGTFKDGEAVPTDRIHGSIIAAESITAEKISVSDLVAFGATIGGFHITDNSIYSEVKDSEGNTTRGVYMDTDGQFNFGDATNYVKYYRDEDGDYKLDISAGNITFRLGDKTIGETISEIESNQTDFTEDLRNLASNVTDHGSRLDYVNITTYEDEPCIELGERDSDFKVLITNTRIMFKHGSDVPTHINTNGLVTQNINVRGEIAQGGYVMLNTVDGGWGLLWKGVALIAFIFDGEEYSLPQDMTWAEFVVSEYNPSTTSPTGHAFYNSGNAILHFGNNSGPNGAVAYNGTRVAVTDVIVDGRIYALE